MGFWDRQVNDLLTGIGELVSGGRLSMAPASPSPSPSPAPPNPPQLSESLLPAYMPPPSGSWPP